MQSSTVVESGTYFSSVMVSTANISIVYTVECFILSEGGIFSCTCRNSSELEGRSWKLQLQKLILNEAFHTV